MNADPNLIPFGIIERVEVVTDGASAVYGSDAVAGVVNYIFRRPFDGGQVSARYTHTKYDEIALNATYGKTWSGGGLILSGAYEHNTNVVRSSIARLAQDQRPYGGGDNRFVGTGTLRWRRKIGQAAKVGSTSLKDGLYDWETEAVLG